VAGGAEPGEQVVVAHDVDVPSRPQEEARDVMLTGIAEARTLARAMHGHLHAVDDAVHGPRAVHARPEHRLLVLQRAAGNRAVVAWVQGDAPVVQRCGGETHAGCPCAEQPGAERP